MCVTHMHTHLYSCLGSVIVSQSAETPSGTPSPHTHTHTAWQTFSQWIHEVGQRIEEDFTLILRILVMSGMSTTSHFCLEKKGALLKILLFTSWQNGDVQTRSFFFPPLKSWPKVEICAWQDSLLSHNLRFHYSHVLKLTLFPSSYLPVLSSSTVILHPSFPGTLMLKCF